jgi:outer membrane protein TolC
MKKIKALLVSLCIGTSLYAQEFAVSTNVASDPALLQRYIELAKEHYPQRKILEATREKAELVYKAVPIGYLDMFNVSYFYRPNEDRIAIDMQNPYTVNGFQFSVNLNLGTFFSRMSQSKQLKQDLKIAEYQQEAYETVLQNEVKKRYYEYLRSKEDLRIKAQALDEYKVLAEGILYKFERGEAELIAYSTARTSVTSAETALLLADVSVLQAKDALEEIIGRKLEEVR